VIEPNLLPLSHDALESFGASVVAPGRMVFSSISGSHLYGFPSKDSDIDLRGTYVAPLRSVVSLRNLVETREVNSTIDGVLVESVFHEVAKYFRLLVRGNGYVIEQILSPIGIARSKEFAQLQRLAPRFMTKKTVLGHYSGFSASQLSLVRRHPHKEVKIILYAFRVLMTGINALRTRQIEANIVELNKTFQFDFIDQLVNMKIARENSPLRDAGHSVDWYVAKAEELRGTLVAEAAASDLPPETDSASIDELDDLLYALRAPGDATEAKE
jgi:predicted nucleotidyltransferase